MCKFRPFLRTHAYAILHDNMRPDTTHTLTGRDVTLKQLRRTARRASAPSVARMAVQRDHSSRWALGPSHTTE